ncbi:hypothetical protein [Fodinicurvata fenggangensis]|uniref:hypothetical protein n=1 Tax=Fodinicurvata fenggangensis TaxID=1121830 RepID=UPI00055654D0|nr:hypothetical protein [Fodinicurvata fenggangensis]
MDFTTHIIRLADTYCQHTGRSHARVATLAYDQGMFFDRLRKGRTCTIATYGKVVQWFSNNWPEDLEWPDDIPRPKPESEAA